MERKATTNAKVPVGITASSVLTLLFFADSRVLWAVVDTNISSDSLSKIWKFIARTFSEVIISECH